MRAMSRRQFVKAAAASAVMGEVVLHANPLGLPLGCQTWPVRKMIAQDFPGTLKQLAAAGFQSIELCSPAGYADSGFGGLSKYSGVELRKILQRCRSHLREQSFLSRRIEKRSGGPDRMGQGCGP